MKIDAVRFNGQLEIPGMVSSSRFRITAAEGFDMTMLPLGVLAKHERREFAVLIPWSRVDSCDVLPEQTLLHHIRCERNGGEWPCGLPGCMTEEQAAKRREAEYSSSGSAGMLGQQQGMSVEQAQMQMGAGMQQPPPKRGPGRPPKAA